MSACFDNCVLAALGFEMIFRLIKRDPGALLDVASIKCVRPILMMCQNSFAYVSSAKCNFSRAGTRSFFNNSAALIWIAEGITSLLDWPMFTLSFGCTGSCE